MNERDKKQHMEQLAGVMASVYAFDVKEKMTVVDLMVLAQIYLKPGITMTEAMKALPDVPLSTVQFSFVSFARMDLIVKKTHPTDYKAKAVYLSSKGEKLASAIFAALKG